MSKKNKIIIFNVLMISAMIIHVGVKMYAHSQHPEYSTPMYTELVNAVYYLIPLLIVDLRNLFYKDESES